SARGYLEKDAPEPIMPDSTPDPPRLTGLGARRQLPETAFDPGDDPLANRLDAGPLIPPPPPDAEFPPGTLLAGRYEVREPVGTGGMGVVLRVFDRKLGRDLAAKVLKADRARDPDVARRFLDEAAVCGRLQHPGVVPLHEIDRLPDGRPFFTMKLVRGRTLGELLKQRPNPAAGLPRFVQVFEQVCQAIAYAHSQGVIHRDLKPSNVMVGEFGEVQVMDWGLAKDLANPRPPLPGSPRPIAEGKADDSSLDVGRRTSDAGRSERAAGPTHVTDVRADAGPGTEAGRMLGTLAYMPPEQATG